MKYENQAMKQRRIFKIVLGLFSVMGMAISSAHPDPRAIIEGARIAATLTQLDEPLKGSLMTGGKRTPIALFLKGQDIQFQYAEHADHWNVFHMRLGDEQFALFRMIDGRQVIFPKDQLTEPIAGTDLTYEDLAFRFFYWPDPQFEGEEQVNGQPCYKIRLNKPSGTPGRYEAVFVWVHQRYGAFMRIRGHDQRGALIKEFQVENVMQVSPDVWTLRRMMVATHHAGNGRRQSITTMTFENPKIRPPRELR